MLFRKGPTAYIGAEGLKENVRCRRCRRMAICKRMPECAALTSKDLIEAIEKEQAITEKMVLAILWGL